MSENKNKWGLTISVKPLVGQMDVPGLGTVDVEHDTLMVFAGSQQIDLNYGRSPVHVGYASKAGRTVEFLTHIRPWPKDALEFICAEVARLTDTPQRRGVVPASTTQVPIVEDLDESE